MAPREMPKKENIKTRNSPRKKYKQKGSPKKEIQEKGSPKKEIQEIQEIQEIRYAQKNTRMEAEAIHNINTSKYTKHV